MACQCNNLATLRKDMEKLVDLINDLRKICRNNKDNVIKTLNSLARTTEFMVKPDNLGNLVVSIKKANNDASSKINGMIDQCLRKKSKLSTKIDSLENEDKTWHRQEALKNAPQKYMV